MKKETKSKRRRNNWTQWFIWTLQFTLDEYVVSSQLSANDVLWLEMLRDDLSAQNLDKCLELYENTEKYKEQIEEILMGLLVVNNETLEKEGIMTAMEKKFNEIVARWAERTGAAQNWEQQGVKQGMQQLLKFWESGHTLEEAKKKFSFA